MLTFQSVLTVAAVLVAFAALLRARHTARRLEQIAEAYWELRYEYGQLRARLEQRAGDDRRADSPVDPVQGGSFVPLSSLKR